MINLPLYEWYELTKKVSQHLFAFIDIVKDLCDNIDDDDDYFELFFPDFLVRKNGKRCREVITELHEWADDDYMHYLTPLHEYALYHILKLCEDLEAEAKRNGESLFDIVEQRDEMPTDDEHFEAYILNNFHNFDFYYNNIFDDLDFLYVGKIFEIFRVSPANYLQIGTDLERFIELMPEDILKNYQILKQQYTRIEATPSVAESETLLSRTREIIDKFKHGISQRGIYRLLWNDDDTPRDEKAVQLLFFSHLDHYCQTVNIDIAKETETGRGLVDFKLSQGNHQKVLIEIKLASSKKVYHGLEMQLVQYLLSERISDAIYIVVLFHAIDEAIVNVLHEKAAQIKEKHQLNIIIESIDARKNKPSASTLPKGTEFSV